MKTQKNKGDEKSVYDFWERSGFFVPKIIPKKKAFVIVQPPPNVTGELHVGHALTAAIQDVLVRYHRLRGDPTLFLPGVDHAGIATQYALEKELKKEGKTRFDLGREKFVERIWQWIEKYGQKIDHQHRRLGVSVDWTRRRFTMDKDYRESVKVAFQKLYDEGLIFRGERIVNWCPRCQTAISDLENVHQEEEGRLYFLDYKTIQIATTRPETIFADVAVAVNPKDKRYRSLIGQQALIPLTKRRIPIIADELVDREFGTGALKITPAHDELDWQIWQKHKGKIPEFPTVITTDGHLAKGNKYVPAKYWGGSTDVARESVLEDLKKSKMLTREEKIKHSVGRCQRCDTVTEPQVSKQWFVKMKPLAKGAIAAVKSGRIKIIPKRFEKVYFNWLTNIRDWCISRQIWWGHPIPIEGETDVLDTWFSSSLWPFATLGWPSRTRGALGKLSDYEYFYPITIMETGYDILFFWVAKMIMLSLHLTKKEPFKIVLLHGLVRDVKGAKMSKTAGNVMDPLELADKYGADSLRMGLIAGTSAGNDMRLYEEKIVSFRNFATKIRNIARFVLELRPGKTRGSLEFNNRDDRWIKTELEKTIQSVTGHLEKFQLHLASEQIYHFIWHKFADVYIEKSKNRRGDAQPVLEYVLKTSLILLHPFMPFLTEEIYQKFVHKKKSIMVENWPIINA